MRKGLLLIAAAVVAAAVAGVAVVRGQERKVPAGDHPEEAEQFAVAEATASLE